MAKWNAPRPLRFRDGREIHRGDTVPKAMLTAGFIGAHFDALTALSADEKNKFEEWKKRNARAAHRWDAVLASPMRTDAGLFVPTNGAESPAVTP